MIEAAIPRLLDDPQHRLAMIDEVMSARVARWPIVNVLHTLLAPLTALWRRNVGAAPATESLVAAYARRRDRPLAQSRRSRRSPCSTSRTRPSRRSTATAACGTTSPRTNATADLRESFAAALERQRDAVMTRSPAAAGSSPR